MEHASDLPAETAAETPAETERRAAAEMARRNILWGWALLGLFVLLFGGTVGVAFVYLWLS
jgi:hypothetical protein